MTTIGSSDSAPGSAAVRGGRALSTAVVLFLVVDAGISLFAPHLLATELTATGFPSDMLRPLALILLVCTLLYAVPQTSLLGAILVTGFLGGAIATHFRLGEIGSPPQLVCLLLGAMTWGGLHLRDERVRTLLPFRAAPNRR